METLTKALAEILKERPAQDAIRHAVERGDAKVKIQLEGGRTVVFRRVGSPRRVKRTAA